MPNRKGLQAVRIGLKDLDQMSQLRSSARRSIVCLGQHDYLALPFPIFLGRTARPPDPDHRDDGASEDGARISDFLRLHVFPDIADRRSFYHGPDGPIHGGPIHPGLDGRGIYQCGPAFCSHSRDFPARVSKLPCIAAIGRAVTPMVNCAAYDFGGTFGGI